MNENPYLKKLKAFNPKTDLSVNETFSFKSEFTDESAIFSVDESDAPQMAHTNSGKEFSSFRTTSAINATLAKVPLPNGSTSLIACDTAGGVFILSEGEYLNALAKFKIAGSIIKKPAYADGVLYITTREGNIYAVNVGSCIQTTNQQKVNILWQKKLPKGIHTEPIATGKLLIVAALDGIYCFEAYYKSMEEKAIGKQLWFQQIPGGTVSTPLIESGIIYIGTEDKKLIAVEYGGERAKIAWQFDVSAQIRVKPTIGLKMNALLFPSLDGSVYCIDKMQKKLRWIFFVKTPVLSSILPLLIEGKEYLFFGADDGFFYCINDNGKEVWKFKTNGKIRTEAAHREGILYFGSEDNNLYALNAKNGNLIFKFPTDGNINGSPVIIDDKIYFGSADSFVHGVRL